MGLAKRAARDQARWSEKTKDLGPLDIGDRVAVQNQTGNNPRRWDKRGVVVDKLPYDQYKVRLDGSRRVTLRNRRYLKPYSALLQDQDRTIIPRQFLPRKQADNEFKKQTSDEFSQFRFTRQPANEETTLDLRRGMESFRQSFGPQQLLPRQM